MSENKMVLPHRYLYPAYYEYYSQSIPRIDVLVNTEHPGVQFNGPITGFNDQEIAIAGSDADVASKVAKCIRLNTAQDSVANLRYSQEGMMFSARFSGNIVHISFPWEAVVCLIAPNNPPLFSLPYFITEEEKMVDVKSAPVAVDPNSEKNADVLNLKDKKPRPKFGVIQGGKPDES